MNEMKNMFFAFCVWSSVSLFTKHEIYQLFFDEEEDVYFESETESEQEENITDYEYKKNSPQSENDEEN